MAHARCAALSLAGDRALSFNGWIDADSAIRTVDTVTKTRIVSRHVNVAQLTVIMATDTSRNVDDDGGTSELVDEAYSDDSCFIAATRTAALAAGERTTVTGADRIVDSGADIAVEDRLSQTGSPGSSTGDAPNKQSPCSPRHLFQSPKLGNEQRQRVTSFSVADILNPTKFQKTPDPQTRTSGERDRDAGNGRSEEEFVWHTSAETVSLAGTQAVTREMENIFRAGEMLLRIQ